MVPCWQYDDDRWILQLEHTSDDVILNQIHWAMAETILTSRRRIPRRVSTAESIVFAKNVRMERETGVFSFC